MILKKKSFCFLLFISIFLIFLPSGLGNGPYLGIKEGDEFLYVITISDKEKFEDIFLMGVPGEVGSFSKIMIKEIQDETTFWNVTIDYLSWDQFQYKDLYIIVPKDSSNPGLNYGFYSQQFFPPFLHLISPGLFPICAKPVVDYIENEHFDDLIGNNINQLDIREDDNYSIQYDYDYESGILHSLDIREMEEGGEKKLCFRFILFSNLSALTTTALFGVSSVIIVVIIMVEMKRRKR